MDVILMLWPQEPTVPNELEAERAPEPVWAWWRMGNDGNWPRVSHAILTNLSRFMLVSQLKHYVC
jgi:hypothetical protein